MRRLLFGLACMVLPSSLAAQVTTVRPVEAVKKSGTQLGQRFRLAAFARHRGASRIRNVSDENLAWD